MFKVDQSKWKERKMKTKYFLSLRYPWTVTFFSFLHVCAFFSISYLLSSENLLLKVSSKAKCWRMCWIIHKVNSTSVLFAVKNCPKSLCCLLLLSPRLPKTLTGLSVCSGPLPDWQRASRKWGCDWLLWDSAGVIRSFNTSQMFVLQQGGWALSWRCVWTRKRTTQQIFPER